ncbi:MAG: hypothetical protein HFJ20_07695 [Clostridia bacterium]|nr:hypothetical protein [Clostridia bacterium]
MVEDLKTVEELRKIAFTVIHSISMSADNKYAVKVIMAEAIHSLEDAVYERHGAITSYGIY